MNEKKSNYICNSKDFANINKVDGIEKKDHYKYLGLKIYFNKKDQIEEAKG